MKYWILRKHTFVYASYSSLLHLLWGKTAWKMCKQFPINSFKILHHKPFMIFKTLHDFLKKISFIFVNIRQNIFPHELKISTLKIVKKKKNSSNLPRIFPRSEILKVSFKNKCIPQDKAFAMPGYFIFTAKICLHPEYAVSYFILPPPKMSSFFLFSFRQCVGGC